jgi:hypothetical protein
MLQSAAMARVKRRYTTVEGTTDWIVSVSYDEGALTRAHWFEAQVSASNEATGAALQLPKELATYRVGETEHPFREYIRMDWAGDTEAALAHLTNTIYRRVYAYIERGH